MSPRPPSRAGVTKNPSAVTKTSRQPVDEPRQRQRQIDAQERLAPVGPQVLRGLEQIDVDPFHDAVDRQHHEGQQDVDHADRHAQPVVEQRQWRVEKPETLQTFVHHAATAQQHHPRIGAHEHAGPERHDDRREHEPRRARPGRGQDEGERVAEHERQERDRRADLEGVGEDLRVDGCAEELAVAREREGRREHARVEKPADRVDEQDAEPRQCGQEQQPVRPPEPCHLSSHAFQRSTRTLRFSPHHAGSTISWRLAFSGRGRHVLGRLRADELERLLIDRPVGDLVGDGRLRLGLGGPRDELHGAVLVLGAARDHPRVPLQLALVPLEAGFRALLLDGEDPPAPRGGQLHLAVGEQLGRLGARGPPHVDLLLDAVHRFERPLDVQGVDLVDRHVVGQQRELQVVGGIVAHGPRAGERLRVPELRPRLGVIALGVLLGAVGQHRRVVDGADAVLVDHLGEDALGVDGLVVERLQEVVLHAGDDVEIAHVDQIPLDVAALDHRLELAVVGRAGLDDLDAGLLLERLEHRLALRFLVGAAPGADDELLALAARGSRPAGLGDRAGRGGEDTHLQHVTPGHRAHGCLLCVKAASGGHRSVTRAPDLEAIGRVQIEPLDGERLAAWRPDDVPHRLADEDRLDDVAGDGSTAGLALGARSRCARAAGRAGRARPAARRRAGPAGEGPRA